MGIAKNYIWDAIIGLVLAILAWLILNVINPDLVNVNLDRFGEVGGTVPSPGQAPGQNAGMGGACQPQTSGNCSTSSPAILSCSHWNSQAASGICYKESGGDALRESLTDKCSDGNSFSIGLYQINIIANGERLGLDKCNPNKAFSKKNGDPLGSQRGDNGGCMNWTTNSNRTKYCSEWNCKVADRTEYAKCKNLMKDVSNNAATACKIYRQQAWSGWPVSKKICGL